MRTASNTKVTKENRQEKKKRLLKVKEEKQGALSNDDFQHTILAVFTSKTLCNTKNMKHITRQEFRELKQMLLEMKFGQQK